MKCNYKKSLQKQNQTLNFVEHVYMEAYKEFYDEKNDALKPEFYDEMFQMITEENKDRLNRGIEKLITVETVDEQTAIYFDEAMPKKVELKTPKDYLGLYAAIQGFMFDTLMSKMK